MKEFWNEMVTKTSWEKLLEISGKFDFILIGGWAAYLWTKTHKSKGIDIVVDYHVLDALRSQFSLNKNERLRKYEIKQDEFDIDVYVAHYSRLAVPVEAIMEYTTKVQGIRTVVPEMLVVLKQGAEIERRGSIKGKKDQIDLITILYYSSFGRRKYLEILKKFSLEGFKDELVGAIRNFDRRDLDYLGITHQQFVKWKKEFIMGMKT